AARARRARRWRSAERQIARRSNPIPPKAWKHHQPFDHPDIGDAASWLTRRRTPFLTPFAPVSEVIGHYALNPFILPLLEIVWVFRGHPDGNFQVATCSILSLSRDHPFRPAMVDHSPSRAAAVKDGALAPPVGLSLTAASAMEHLGHNWDEGIRVRVACR